MHTPQSTPLTPPFNENSYYPISPDKKTVAQESGELDDLHNTVQLVSDKGRIRVQLHPRVRHMSSQPFSNVLVTFSSICIDYLMGLPLCFKPIFK